MIYFLLAWRNLWRNKRRTFISISSVCFAVLLATFMRSMQLGTYDLMIENMVGQYTGHLQIHSKKYKDTESLESGFIWNNKNKSQFDALPFIKNYTPRIESFALLSAGEKSKGVGVIGVDPISEDAFTQLKSKVTEGEYFNGQNKHVLLSEGLASYLNVSVNDSLILYGQGLYGVTAADIYRIQGLVHYGSPDLNNKMAFIDIQSVSDFFSLENKVTSISIMISDLKNLNVSKEVIQKTMNDDLIVETWEELLPDLVQMIEMDNVSGVIILIILYLVIAFGLFGTSMMVALERKREIATLLSIGMSRIKLMVIMLYETLMISFVGLFSGFVITFPMVYYFNKFPIELTGEIAEVTKSYGMEPIMPTSLEPSIFINQLIVISVVALICSMYPIVMVRKLNIIKALRSS